jgi:hypothetical protein
MSAVAIYKVLVNTLGSDTMHIPRLQCTCLRHSSGPGDSLLTDEQIEAYDEIKKLIAALLIE